MAKVEAGVQRGGRGRDWRQTFKEEREGETKGRHSKGRERGKLEAGVKRGGRGGNLRYFLKPDNVLFVQ